MQSFENIQMVDLKSQYLKIKPEVDKAIQDVIDSTAFIKGEPVKLFERELAEYLGVKHVVGCANGTDALQIALMALGLKPGDEVITPDFTFIATVEVVALLGLKPVLVDVNIDDYTIDVNSLEAAITPRTKAIIPVHLFGQCANMEAILRIAKKHNLFVVEDNAQAIGADYYFTDGTSRKAGTIGDIGCTSFFPSKNLGCYGDGGALFTNDDSLAEQIRSISNHGMKVRYHHDRIGVNSRLDTIQAAILREKLPHLDEYNAARISAADNYDRLFSGNSKVLVPKRVSWSNHVFHQYTLRVFGVDRQRLIAGLAERSIPAMVYYPIPLHSQIAFKEFSKDAKVKEFPNTDKLCESVLSLPIHTELNFEIQEFISKNFLELL
ncbi:MAG TPA: DegT/DnrJ/EryC1/StrS family aminotransferase [Tenuifilaceae bacterium]|nr:DegT/DnrJ/EryC1/StrS family aminotransferase [Tenuifilaceae bacterium]HPE17119.1 DegT/DnrJ/EryC1/StrS family aminotransferase [Tenuifilaceae bacterium]HPJ45847.1 DegT/DnrJ/EryC1/StrS family aminotransferase [Tenuifilaceae bacterium]HPQ34122.1 DegT/DnrJ/EryC1/StrS family aminotransferase [Tenuifilaceae bacterium]HRX68700.1 DegT/DnrJ/EryC1/StrS family aminotransferase [Tenuifilaceae bacterium]